MIGHLHEYCNLVLAMVSVFFIANISVIGTLVNLLIGASLNIILIMYLNTSHLPIHNAFLVYDK